MKQIFFIRHGESLSNAGEKWQGDYKNIPLNPVGINQAKQVSLFFTESPDLILHTKYLRTLETATPLINRFPSAPVEMTELHEFTYLNLENFHSTTQEERKNSAIRYWTTADPTYNDGGGAESFDEFYERITNALIKIKNKTESVVVIFCHGNVMKLIRLLHDPEKMNWSTKKMIESFSIMPETKNGEILRLTKDDDGHWSNLETVFTPEIED